MRAVGDLKLGVIGAHAAGSEVQFEVRAFIPAMRVAEDPVTGSLNAGLAQWLIGAGLAPPRYVAAQGAALGRAGRVFVEHDGADVWIGGACQRLHRRHGAAVSKLCEVDHLVVAAATLEAGARWCEATLGVVPGPGGKHPVMGTHNRLLQHRQRGVPAHLPGDHRHRPGGAAARARALVRPGRRVDLDDGPRLVHFVARAAALDARCEALRAAGLDTGPAIAASRDTPQGRLAWRIAVRDDGSLLAGGALPTLIEWGPRHPTEAMPDSGVTLRSWRCGDCRPPRRACCNCAASSSSRARARRSRPRSTRRVAPSASHRHDRRTVPRRRAPARVRAPPCSRSTKAAWCSTAPCSTRWAAARPAMPARLVGADGQQLRDRRHAQEQGASGRHRCTCRRRRATPSALRAGHGGDGADRRRAAPRATCASTPPPTCCARWCRTRWTAARSRPTTRGWTST